MAGFRTQWRWLSWVLMAIVGAAFLIIGATTDSGPQTDGERVSQLASTIRCPQCRGQSVFDSNVAIAREIRGDISTRIAAGQTDDEIRQVYIERYGRSIVLTPDSGGFTGLVWIVPVAATGLALAAIALAFQRWRAEAAAIIAATDADHELVAELRADRASEHVPRAQRPVSAANKSGTIGLEATGLEQSEQSPGASSLEA